MPTRGSRGDARGDQKPETFLFWPYIFYYIFKDFMLYEMWFLIVSNFSFN